MKLGSINVANMYLGSSTVQKVYLGSNVVWQNVPVATAATGIGTTSFTANWETYGGAAYYLLDVSLNSSFSTFVLQGKIVVAPDTSYLVTGLTPDTTYYYRVRASTDPFLLDEYTGATVAFSLRLLNPDYTGNAVRVRRASDNTESEIGFLDGVLDTSTLESFCSGTDGFVTRWYDQSGNGRDVRMTTASKQPQIVTSGSVILENGKPCMFFDQTKSHELLFITSFTIGVNGSFFLVLNVNINASYGGLMNSPAAYGYMFHTTSGGYGYFTTGYNGVITPVVKDTQRLISMLHNSTTLVGYENSVAKTTRGITNNGTPTPTGIFTNWAGRSFHGLAQELVLYPTYATSERAGIENNINNFYNVF